MSAKSRFLKRDQNPLPVDWTVSEEFTWNGRHVRPGTELKISGEPGRWRFQRHVRKDDGREWIDVVGGTKGRSHMRSFRPERVRTVHRTKKTMTASEARRLVNEKNRTKREERASEETTA